MTEGNGPPRPGLDVVVVSGLSGAGRSTAAKCLEDLGYYSVDNLPIDLIPKFAELTEVALNIRRAALVVDVPERQVLALLPSGTDVLVGTGDGGAIWCCAPSLGRRRGHGHGRWDAHAAPGQGTRDSRPAIAGTE